MFHHILKHLKVRQEYLAKRHVFQLLLDVWKCSFVAITGMFQWCEPEKRLPFIETVYSWKMCSIIAQNAIDDTEYS